MTAVASLTHVQIMVDEYCSPNSKINNIKELELIFIDIFSPSELHLLTKNISSKHSATSVQRVAYPQ